MTSVGSRVLTMAAASFAAVFAGIGPAMAGGVPAPLVGVTGPVGIVAAGVAYAGYLLYKRYRR
jgi:hypothetical protein